jgi:hypothetical protein
MSRCVKPSGILSDPSPRPGDLPGTGIGLELASGGDEVRPEVKVGVGLAGVLSRRTAATRFAIVRERMNAIRARGRR